MPGSARSTSSLRADLLALRRCLSPLFNCVALDDLLFACTQHLIRDTAGGVTAHDVFEFLGRAAPQAGATHLDIAFSPEADETTLGYIYQLLQLERRAELQTRIQQANKTTSTDDLIAFTSLYTPDWVVRFLIARSCNLDAIARASDGLAIARSSDGPETALFCNRSAGACADLLDPSCGSGHFLLEAAKHLPLNRIAGYDIDETGLFIARLSLVVQALRRGAALDAIPELDLYCLDALVRHDEEPRFDAVVGNPPYIGRKLMDRELKQRLKVDYPASHSDLCAAFLQRGLELLKPGGKLAFITQASLLVLPTYEDLRHNILQEHRLDTVVELGPHVFPLVTGEKVNSVLLVIQKGQASSAPCAYLDLREFNDKESRLQNARWTPIEQTLFETTRAHAFNFSCPPSLFAIRHRAAKLAEHADIRQGLATTENATFVRRRSEVPEEEIGVRWIPYAKGSGGERWFAPIDTVVDWANGGEAIKRRVAEKYPYLAGKTEWVVKNEQYYFREGLTFSFVNSKQLAVRWLPPGCIFDVGGSALFSDEHWFLLAYLNSSFIASCANLLNPTINFQVGDLKELPYVSVDAKDMLAEHAKQCVQLKKMYFNAAREWTYEDSLELKRLEEEIDDAVLTAARRVVADIDVSCTRTLLRRR